MLSYCFVPVEASFPEAGPDLLPALRSAHELLTELEGQGWQTLCEMGLVKEQDTPPIRFECGQLVTGSNQMTVPFTSSSHGPALLCIDADLTLSGVGPGLCHLSIRGSTAGHMTHSMVSDREYQMVLEVALYRFLKIIARNLTGAPHRIGGLRQAERVRVD